MSDGHHRAVRPPAGPDQPRGFPVRTLQFTHGPITLELRLPQSADDLIDESRFEKDEYMPYWADLWPSAIGLARHLIDHPIARTQRIMELGCGLGLPSLVLKRLGYTVQGTDWSEEGLAFARENARLNEMDDLPFHLLNWQSPPSDLEPVDVVIGADLVYERRNVTTLVALVPKILQPGGRLLLADPGRMHFQTMRDALQDDGWKTSIVETMEVEQATSNGPARSRISILDAHR